MSYCTPAALKAFSRNGRSAVSQRTDDLLSGRITPSFCVFAELVPSLFPELHAVKPPRTRRLAAAKVQMPLRIADPFWGVPPGRRQVLRISYGTDDPGAHGRCTVPLRFQGELELLCPATYASRPVP